MKTKFFLLKTNVLKFTQQKCEHKNQRNKRFIKLFTNVQYGEPMHTLRYGAEHVILAQGCPNFMGRGPHSARKLDRGPRLTFFLLCTVSPYQM